MSEVTSLRTTSRAVISSGVFIRSPIQIKSLMVLRLMQFLQRWRMTAGATLALGQPTAVVALPGTLLSTTQSMTRSSWASETARPGMRLYATLRVILVVPTTTSSYPPYSHLTRILALIGGITRQHRVISGTLRPLNKWCLQIFRLEKMARAAEWSCRRPRTASFTCLMLKMESFCRRHRSPSRIGPRVRSTRMVGL